MYNIGVWGNGIIDIFCALVCKVGINYLYLYYG